MPWDYYGLLHGVFPFGRPAAEASISYVQTPLCAIERLASRETRPLTHPMHTCLKAIPTCLPLSLVGLGRYTSWCDIIAQLRHDCLPPSSSQFRRSRQEATSTITGNLASRGPCLDLVDQQRISYSEIVGISCSRIGHCVTAPDLYLSNR